MFLNQQFGLIILLYHNKTTNKFFQDKYPGQTHQKEKNRYRNHIGTPSRWMAYKEYKMSQ